VSLFDVASGRRERLEVKQSPEALQEWIGQLRSRYGNHGDVAIVLEQGRGALLNALMGCEFLVLYIINPKSLSSYREAFYGSGAKTDPVDAELMQEMVRKNPDRFRAWHADDVLTRSLRLMTEGRRELVNQVTATTNQLTAILKSYYPQALSWAGPLNTVAACDFLEQWPTLQALQCSSRRQILRFFQKHAQPALDLDQQLKRFSEALPLTKDEAVLEYSSLMVQALIPQLRALLVSIAAFDKKITELFLKHPDRPIFESFPGAGAVLAPRLVAAFGVDRERFKAASEMQQFCGIAPVTEKSGKQHWVHWRMACPKFIRQTFHEFADHSRRWSAWAKAYYQLQIDHGKKHHAAIRALAFKWIRILFRCWSQRVPYVEQTYIESLTKRCSPLLQNLPAVKNI
jgi:transposase